MAGEIDDWIDSRRYQTPVGGEIAVDSAETFDYPVTPASDDTMEELHNALDKVLTDYRDRPGVREGFRAALVEALEDASDTSDLDEILAGIDIPEVDGKDRQS